jgi:hypothetical protein
MRRLEARMLKVYALLLCGCLPFVLRDPTRPLPGMVPVMAFEHRLFHPSLWFSAVEAGSSTVEAWDPLPQEKRVLESLEQGLKREAHTGARERLKVRRAEGSGGAGWPDILVVEKSWTDADRTWLDGCPVVRGMDLVGFVDVSQGDAERHDLQARGLLRIQLLNHKSDAPTTRSFVALAESQRKAEGTLIRPIRLVLQASDRKGLFPLRSLRSSPEQADTDSNTKGPFLARLMQSTELHPALPEGLVLGWIRDEVYEREGFVSSRWVLPRWHPAGLVQVELLGDGKAGQAAPTTPEESMRWPAERRTSAQVLWRSPERLGYRRYLLQGSGLKAGMAVLSGARCLGRIEWAHGELGLAVPLSKRGGVLPMLWWGGEGRRVHAIVVEGLGSATRSDRFRLLHPTVLTPGFLQGGLLFSGAVGRRFPAGLPITGLFRLDETTLSFEDQTLQSWPRMVEVSALSGGSR